MILNGSVAVAGGMPGMSTSNHANAAQSAPAGPVGEVRCHEDAMQSGSGHPGALAGVDIESLLQLETLPDADDSSRPAMPDCCKSGICHCASVQATATVDFLPLPVVTIATTALAAFVDNGIAVQHPSRLDRPPIG